MLAQQNWSTAGYQELTPAQLLADQWLELCFDLASGQNVIQDLVVPETGGGYVYKDAKTIGSPTHNRFIYWRTTNDILELVEISTETVLEGSQIRIRLSNSPILNNISIIELPESIVIMIATLNSVHRLHLPHPKTTGKSVLQELNNEMLFSSSNYHIISNSTSNSQHPICSTFWRDGDYTKCAVSFPDSSLLVVQFNFETGQTTSFDIKQTGIIGRIWSKMPNLLARTNVNDYANAIFICEPYKHKETNDVLLFGLCRDIKIRVFSTVAKEAVLTHPLISQNSFTQSFSNATGEPPLMKMFGPHLVIYINEGSPEFVILTHIYEDESHVLREKFTFHAPLWCEKLIDFRLTENKLWCLALSNDSKSQLGYVDFRDPIDEIDDGFEVLWELVSMADGFEMPMIKNYVAEIFWRGRFSVNAVQKALFGFSRPSAIRETDMSSLENLAFTTIVDQNQTEAWAKFYNYCVQSQESFNKSIGLVIGQDENVVSIIKRSNISFVCPLLGNIDIELQEGPYRGIEISPSTGGIFEPLSYVTDLIDEDTYRRFDEKLSDDLQNCSVYIEELVDCLAEKNEIDYRKLNFDHPHLIESNIEHICEQLDLTSYSIEYGKSVLLVNESKIQSDHKPLESNCGISLTFEMFKRLVIARLFLARDLLVYIHLMPSYFSKDSSQAHQLKYLHSDLYKTGKVRNLLDCLRCYQILIWIADSPIKTVGIALTNPEMVNFIGSKFHFFKKVSKPYDRTLISGNESILYQNLFMNFLINGGVNFLKADQLENEQTLSDSLYITEIALNLCKLLWPKSNHLCLAEYLFTHRLEDHLDKYLSLCDGWIPECETDRHFMKAANCLLQRRPMQSVDIFNRLWTTLEDTNMPGRFIGLEKRDQNISAEETSITSPIVIFQYYSKLIQLFQLHNNPQCLVSLIGYCLSLLDSNDSEQQNWINCFRAKLFQYHLELENTDEAYHTMALTTDSSLRTNCLRKFIIHHCEKEQWSSLLGYPLSEIRDEFLEIIKQKADNSDLSKLADADFYKTTYYDLLFALHTSDEEYKPAAQIMYNYAQRLAYEVPGIVSVRKQADCLLAALNSLRCVDSSRPFIEEVSSIQSNNPGRTSVLKRAHDSEIDVTTSSEANDDETKHIIETTPSFIYCKDLKLKYELIRARLKLLERDQTANAIALSPLKEEETVSQLVASSMFPTAIDLALLFKTPLEPVLEGLTGKFIFIMQLSTVDIALHQNLNKDLYDIFTGSYTNIDTYNYIANSTSACVDKLWRLIDYYLLSYDGISHRYSLDTFSSTFTGTTVLMKVVANKLLSSGYDVPASLKRMYMTRNTAELLKLLIKYDKLIEASELTIEMINRILEQTMAFSTTDSPPVYLPTHLIFLLISYLTEDATNKSNMEMANILTSKINKFRSSVKAFTPIAN